MVRIPIESKYSKDLTYIEAYGLSTDTKPVGNVVTGSMFVEIDTGTIYLYNEEGASNEEWVAFAQFTVEG